jgi:hypothetical protein
MKKFLAITAVAMAFGIATPAMSATSAECNAHWTKIENKKVGYVMASDAKSHHDKMTKAGRKMAAADRITEQEFMDSCIADIFDKSGQ